MKLRIDNQRILSRMLFRLASTAMPLLLLLAASAWGQRIERVEGSRFETEAVVQNLSDLPFENLSFRSSSFLGGTFVVRTADVEVPRLTFKKILKASSTTQAEEFAEYISVKVEELENELAVQADSKSRPPWSGTDWSGRIDVTIEVPRMENLKVYAYTTAYTIDVTGPFSSVDVTNDLGPIAISKISRKVKVAAENCSVRVEDCDGPVTVRTSLRPIVLANVDSKLGTIKLRNTNGKIQLESVRGEIDARTEFAPIHASRLQIAPGRSKIRTENSNIKLETIKIEGDLVLIDAHGNIDLSVPELTSASYRLQVDEGGRIYTKGIPLRTDLVKRTMLQGSTGDKKYNIDIDMRGVGTINLAGFSTEEHPNGDL